MLVAKSLRASFRDRGRYEEGGGCRIFLNRRAKKGVLFIRCIVGKLLANGRDDRKRSKADFSSISAKVAKHSELALQKKRSLSFLSLPLLIFACLSICLSLILYLSRSPSSSLSRAAFRMFGRALNWPPFKTWELFNAPPRYASAVCYLASRACYVTRVTRARREKCRAVDGTLWLSIRY